MRVALASHLSFGQPIASKGSLIVIAFPAKDYFHKETVESAKNTKCIEEAMSALMDKAVGAQFVLKDTGPANLQSLPESNQQNQPPADVASDDEDNNFINNLLDTFGGKFQTDDE